MSRGGGARGEVARVRPAKQRVGVWIHERASCAGAFVGGAVRDGGVRVVSERVRGERDDARGDVRIERVRNF